MTEKIKKSELQPSPNPPKEMKVRLNQSHTEGLLKKAGYLAPEDSLTTLKDEAKIKRIANNFQLTSDDDNSMFLIEMSEKDIEEADSEDLSHIAQEIRQLNKVANAINIFDSVMKFDVAAMTAKHGEYLRSNLEKFAQHYPTIEENLAVLRKVKDVLASKVTPEQFQEYQEYIAKSQGIILASEIESPETKYPLVGRLLAAEDGLAIMERQQREADAFLRDKVKLQKLKDAADKFNINFPPILEESLEKALQSPTVVPPTAA